ncbi:MAG TPA: zinc-dependent metalloprotease [Acidimicrobiales bacterium]|nr:zinc-dependent metalloprotease [Acidimicrobiales bacterium]
MSPAAERAGRRGDGPVSWELAERIAVRVAARQPSVVPGRARVLEEDFAELTAEAEELVSAETGLVSDAGAARARVTDRPGWARANVASMRRLLSPLTAKLEEAMAKPALSLGPVPLRAPIEVTRQLSGAQLGLLLGWVSTRVLGQYDQLLIEDDTAEEQDIVYYVGPNIIELEDRFGFQPRQFRLWIALHEVTHRTQFTGVPWLRPYFFQMVSSLLEGVEPGPQHFVEALRRSVTEARSGVNPLKEAGILGLLASPAQREALDKIGGLMSLLEGHGDIVMNRAAAGRLPQAPRFAQTLSERRERAGAAKAISTLVGLDAKMRQYRLGEQFVTEVESAGGRDLFDLVWSGPEYLPTMSEIKAPFLWVERVGGLGRTA